MENQYIKGDTFKLTKSVYWYPELQKDNLVTLVAINGDTYTVKSPSNATYYVSKNILEYYDALLKSPVSNETEKLVEEIVQFNKQQYIDSQLDSGNFDELKSFITK